MKIMFYTSSLGKGGAERVITTLANNLVKKHNIDIVVNVKEISYEINEKIKIISLDNKYIKSNIIRNFNRIIKTKQIIKEEKPDIIISFLPLPSYRILMLKKCFKDIPIIISDRNDPNQEYKSILNKILMKNLYKKADGFVFQTYQQKEFFPKQIKEKSIIIRNPIKNEFLKNEKREKEKTIINVGRLVEQKNQRMLIDVFSELDSTYSEYTLKIFGEGPLKEELQKHIDNLGLSNRVKLCGISNNIKNELEKSMLFVLSSNYEGMPNVLIEAMAIGLPVISTNCPCGGPEELINNGQNGILIPVRDKEKLKQEMQNILNNKEFAENIAKKAQNVISELKEDKIIEKWERYIIKIIRGKRNGC